MSLDLQFEAPKPYKRDVVFWTGIEASAVVLTGLAS